jgi:hypothetical protein
VTDQGNATSDFNHSLGLPMYFFMPIIFFWIGAAIFWITYSRVLRHQAEIRQVPDQLLLVLFFRGYLRVTTLLFVSPPVPLKNMMFPMPKMMAVSIFISLFGLGLFWVTT